MVIEGDVTHFDSFVSLEIGDDIADLLGFLHRPVHLRARHDLGWRGKELRQCFVIPGDIGGSERLGIGIALLLRNTRTGYAEQVRTDAPARALLDRVAGRTDLSERRRSARRITSGYFLARRWRGMAPAARRRSDCKP